MIRSRQSFWQLVVALCVIQLISIEGQGNVFRQDDNNLIKISTSLSNSKSTTPGVNTVQVTVSLQGESLTKRVPVSLSLILDASENVVTDKQDQFLKDSLQILLDNTVIGQDYLGLSTFATQASEVIQLTLVDSDATLGQLKGTVDSLQFGGASALSDSLKIGLNQQLSTSLDLPEVKGVILFNTGAPNVGVVGGDQIRELISSFQDTSDNPVRVFTVGQGSAAEPQTLSLIAEEGDGAFFFLRKPSDIQKAMGISFAGLVSTYYQDIILNLDTRNNAVFKDVTASGKVSVTSSQAAQISLRDLLGEEQIDLLVTLDVPFGSGDNLTEILDITLGYTDNLRGVVETLSGIVDVDLNQTIQNPFGDITNLRFQIIEALTKTSKSLSNNQVGEAKKSVEAAKQMIEEVKLGGVESLLAENTQGTQTLETVSRKRKLLQSFGGQSEYYSKWLQAFQAVIQDAEAFTNLDDLLQAASIIGGLQETLSKQRLSFLPDPEFSASQPLIELTGNSWIRQFATEGLTPNAQFDPTPPSSDTSQNTPVDTPQDPAAPPEDPVVPPDEPTAPQDPAPPPEDSDQPAAPPEDPVAPPDEPTAPQDPAPPPQDPTPTRQPRATPPVQPAPAPAPPVQTPTSTPELSLFQQLRDNLLAQVSTFSPTGSLDAILTCECPTDGANCGSECINLCDALVVYLGLQVDTSGEVIVVDSFSNDGLQQSIAAENALCDCFLREKKGKCDDRICLLEQAYTAQVGILLPQCPLKG